MVLRIEVPEYASILNGRFVLAIKDKRAYNELWKDRSVVQGQCNAMKEPGFHDISVARQHTAKIVGLAAIFAFRIFSSNITQACLQPNGK